jgi:hypothetical protein
MLCACLPVTPPSVLACVQAIASLAATHKGEVAALEERHKGDLAGVKGVRPRRALQLQQSFQDLQVRTPQSTSTCVRKALHLPPHQES